jgi:hypothetical protein
MVLFWVQGYMVCGIRRQGYQTTRKPVAAADNFVIFGVSLISSRLANPVAERRCKCALATYGPRTEQRDVYNNNALTNAMFSIKSPAKDSIVNVIRRRLPLGQVRHATVMCLSHNSDARLLSVIATARLYKDWTCPPVMFTCLWILRILLTSILL